MKGLLLINLGSPDSTSISDVKKYLDEFLMDKCPKYDFTAKLCIIRLNYLNRSAFKASFSDSKLTHV